VLLNGLMDDAFGGLRQPAGTRQPIPRQKRTDIVIIGRELAKQHPNTALLQAERSRHGVDLANRPVGRTRQLHKQVAAARSLRPLSLAMVLLIQD
jgi:hypothetical protein